MQSVVRFHVFVLVSIAIVFANQPALSENAFETTLRNVERSLCKAVKSNRCANRNAKPRISKSGKTKTVTAPAPVENPTTTKTVSPPALVEKSAPPLPREKLQAPVEKPEPPLPREKPQAPVEKPAPPLPLPKVEPEEIPPEPTIEAVPPSPPKPNRSAPKSIVVAPGELIPAQKFPDDATQCQAALTKLNVNFASNPAYGQQGSCLIANPVQLKSYMVNGQKLEFPDQPNLACSYALQFINFIRENAEPAIATQTSSHIAKLYTGPGFVCRGRNGDISSKLSEHAYGNAVDIERIQLANGRVILVKDAISATNGDYAVLTTIRQAACKYFTTVLGPGANEAHASHFHFDLGQHGKSGTYRICE